ncbi:MAG: hypothetical protein HYY35_02665 [Deltaproteobacteria bacterium]|nr:hypothetical protein [Deltaproteobacteria bacterium]
MTCAYCPFQGHRRAVHAHLEEAHAPEVRTRSEAETGRMFFSLSCPKCAQTMEKRVKPRWQDPGFLEEFSREIRLVAFDLLLYHLEDHEPHGEEKRS